MEATTLSDTQRRFLSQINPISKGGCWLWRGGLNAYGYGSFWNGSKLVMAHRYSYEFAYGPIPEGLELDHVWARGCRNKHCVRPTHLEPVTHKENMVRAYQIPRPKQPSKIQDFCMQGHPMSGDNLYVSPKGQRKCKACARIRDAKRRPRPQWTRQTTQREEVA